MLRIEPTRQTGMAVSAPADERIASELTGAAFFSGTISPCGHQLPFGAFADVEFFDLFARFDRFDYGADAEYKVFRHGIGRFVS